MWVLNFISEPTPNFFNFIYIRDSAISLIRYSTVSFKIRRNPSA